jgi:hypothetical protein
MTRAAWITRERREEERKRERKRREKEEADGSLSFSLVTQNGLVRLRRAVYSGVTETQVAHSE